MTPARKWRTGPDQENCSGGYNIVDHRGVRVAHTSRVVSGGVELVSEAEAAAHAELIVAAVNVYVDAREALKTEESPHA